MAQATIQNIGDTPAFVGQKTNLRLVKSTLGACIKLERLSLSVTVNLCQSLSVTSSLF
jgi:hypothetical protein